MARLSPTKRKAARVRRGASLQRREFKNLIGQADVYMKEQQSRYQQLTITLLSVLQQSGGAITITKGTFAQVLENLNKLSWTATPGTEENETTISLIDTSITTPLTTVGADNHV